MTEYRLNAFPIKKWYNTFVNLNPLTKESSLMKRREFLTASGLGIAALSTLPTASAQVRRARRDSARQFIELRKYTVKDADKRAKLVAILDKALIPALNRQGLKPVGVLIPKESETKFAQNVFVVIPHQTMDSFVNVNAKLVADSVYRKDAAPIFETTSKNPVYTDCETWLLQCFPTIPSLETPELGANRVYQMRQYRSFNIDRNDAKMKMFYQGGELPLFRKVGMNPIFFGNIVAGSRMPAFWYMIGFASEEAQGKAWNAFGSHPDWAAIKDLPEYADTATEIDNIVLLPSPGSQF
jgi:hypothetical protein